MALILNIETATPVLSISLSKDGNCIACKISEEQNSHAEFITLFIEEIMNENKVSFSNIDAVAVSEGPGSYTGLRIGVSVAKGICYAKNIPLIAINTLTSMANGLSKNIHTDDVKGFICPQIDARRMEVYDAIYTLKGDLIREVQPTIVDENTYLNLLEESIIYFGGTGTEKCKSVINHNNANFIDDFIPSAEYLCDLAEKKFQQQLFEDTAYFEPFYLKSFIAKKSKVKGLYD